jgi:phage protein D
LPNNFVRCLARKFPVVAVVNSKKGLHKAKPKSSSSSKAFSKAVLVNFGVL